MDYWDQSVFGIFSELERSFCNYEMLKIDESLIASDFFPWNVEVSHAVGAAYGVVNTDWL